MSEPDLSYAMSDGSGRHPATRKCLYCDGEGRVADSEDHEPWSIWKSLPPGSNLAVVFGVVKPIDCPRCNGSGEVAQ